MLPTTELSLRFAQRGETVQQLGTGKHLSGDLNLTKEEVAAMMKGFGD